MKMNYIFIKGKDDFCQDIEQFKNLLSSNVRLEIKEKQIIADHKELAYSIVMCNVAASNEVVFHVSLEAKQENEEDQIEALECAEDVLRRVNGKYKAFLINTIRDDISQYYGRKLFPKIVEAEGLLREIIYLFMLKNVGSKWLKEQSPEEVKKAILNTAEKNQSQGFYPDTDALIYADFITLGWFFFSKYPLKTNYQELVRKLKEKENLEQEKLTALIEQFESRSNWERYFADKITVEKLSEKWNQLYCYRNMVAHTKKIRKDDYKHATEILNEILPAFKNCLENMNSINMTEEESEAVEAVAEQTIARKIVPIKSKAEDNELYPLHYSPLISIDGLGDSLLSMKGLSDRYSKLLPSDGLLSATSTWADSLEIPPKPHLFNGLLDTSELTISPLSKLFTTGNISAAETALVESLETLKVTAQPTADFLKPGKETK